MDDASNQSAPQIDLFIRRALSHPKRTAMLGYLMQKRGRGTDETELADAFDLPTATARYHLTVLRNATLIADAEGQEAGTATRYVAAASAGT